MNISANNITAGGNISATNISSNDLTTNTSTINDLTVANSLSLSNTIDLNCDNINSNGTITSNSIATSNLSSNSIILNNVNLNTRLTNIENKNTTQDNNIATNTSNITTNTNNISTINSSLTSYSNSITSLQNNISGISKYYDFNAIYTKPSPISSGNETGVFATFYITSAMSLLGSIVYNFPIAIRYTNLVNLNFSTTNTLTDLVIKIYKNNNLFSTITNPTSSTSYSTSFTVNNNGNNNIGGQGEQYFGNITVDFQPSTISNGTDVYTLKATPTFDYTSSSSNWAVQLVPNTTVATQVLHNNVIIFNTQTPSGYSPSSYTHYPLTKDDNFITCDYGLFSNAKINSKAEINNIYCTNIASSNPSNDEINVIDVINFNDTINAKGLLHLDTSICNSYLNVSGTSITISTSNIYPVYFLRNSNDTTVTLTDLGSKYDGLTITIRNLTSSTYRIQGSGVVIRDVFNNDGTINSSNENVSVMMFVNADDKWYELNRS